MNENAATKDTIEKGQTMNAHTTGAFTPARIVALVLIALVALGLGYLRFKPDAQAISVPAGAKAGELILKPGTYATEKGDYKADIGTLVVPENRADPHSRLIALPVIRIRARSAHPGEPIFRLEGGPGGTNMEFEQASRYAERHDVVLVGYRGVDGSVRLDAPEVEAALKHSPDLLSVASQRAYGEAFKASAKRLRAEGVDLAGYTLTQQVEDLEAARVALGYDRIDLISESAGTRTAMIYAWRHPRNIRRSIMVGVNPPGNFLWDPKATEQEIARYSALYAKQADAAKRTDDLAATIRRANVNMPDHWLLLPIKKGNVRVASFMGMAESTTAAGPFSAPLVLDAWLSAAGGDASGLWVTTLITDLMFPKLFVWGQYAAAGSIDAQAARDYFASIRQDKTNLGYDASTFVWAGGRLADAWPADPNEGDYSRVRTSNVETLLIGGELDFATPPQIATKELLPYLPNGHQVVLAGIGHSGSFWHYQVPAGTRLVNTFLDSGRIDDSLYTAGKVDFRPAFTMTMLAKIVAGSMVGLALVAVVSLLWMARRAHKRVAFGPKKSALLRSLYPFVLGLGGWCLGALLVLTSLPTVPLDNELLAVLTVGVPVGLGIHWARAGGDTTGTGRTASLLLACGSALVGAWLGFHVTDVLSAALIYAIAGATIASNLILIVLDVAGERADRTSMTAANAGAHPLPATAGQTAPAYREGHGQ